MQAARALSRMSAVAAPLRQTGQQLRRMGGGHGHGHGPKKTLPPKPATLKDNATLGEKIEYALWDKRHPDYEGVESYVRFYLPGNHQIVIAILGLYATIATYYSIKGKYTKASEMRALPAPAKPDFSSPIVVSSDIPAFGTPEWEKFIEAGGDKAFEDWVNAPSSEAATA